MKKIRYFLEACLVYSLFKIFGMMPMDKASACGGWLGRTIGSFMGASRKAESHIRKALPEKNDAEVKDILRGMWDNLGRNLAEAPHLEEICMKRVEVINPEIFTDLQNDNKPAVVFTGHLANWEIACPTPYLHKGIDIVPLYRAPNNPWIDRLLNRTRSLEGRLKTIAKSKSSARQIMEAMKNGSHMGILIDQKYNQGIMIPFFGHDAKTSPAFVQFAQKFDCPLVPARLERLGGVHFRLSMQPRMNIFNADGTPRPVEDVMIEANTMLEEWISLRPEQWLWLHRRWPKIKNKNKKNKAA